MAPRRQSELYRAAVVLAAAAIFSAGLPQLAGEGGIDWPVGVALVIAGVLAFRFPLHVSLSQKVSVDSAVFFACVLLLPAWQAAAVIAATQAIDVVMAATRRALASREKPP
ncbi:MAG TPA: hypothetical protein VET26_05635, partial [Candidatus Sulfotelmatobacter sp.]|nr:hypothetical protein [Candidatus Sulfotelmatobacter sp.]